MNSILLDKLSAYRESGEYLTNYVPLMLYLKAKELIFDHNKLVGSIAFMIEFEDNDFEETRLFRETSPSQDLSKFFDYANDISLINDEPAKLDEFDTFVKSIEDLLLKFYGDDVIVLITRNGKTAFETFNY